MCNNVSLNESKSDTQNTVQRQPGSQLTQALHCVVQVAYPEVFEKLRRSQSAYDKSSLHEDELTKKLEEVQGQYADTDQKRSAAESMVAALKAELGRFYKLPSPCGGVCAACPTAEVSEEESTKPPPCLSALS